MAHDASTAKRKTRKKQKHRPHTPATLGPRVYQRGRWYAADLRPWGFGRMPLRDPKAVGWPGAGERTEIEEVAARWAWALLDHLRDETQARQLGQRTGKRKLLGAEVLAYLGRREKGKATKTVANDHAVLTVHLVPFVGATLPAEQVDAPLMQRWADSLIARQYNRSSVAQYLATARTFFRERSGGAHDPTKTVRLPIVKHVEGGGEAVVTFTVGELARMRDAADALDKAAPTVVRGRRRRSYRLALELALNTGLRAAELAAISWEAFNATDKTVRVRAQAPLAGTEAPLAQLKGRRSRTALVLPAWWEFHDAEASGCVLSSDGGVYVSTKSVQHWLDTILHKAGLKVPGRCVHICRHTYATSVLEAGGRLEELQRFLGHQWIRTTEAYYQHFTSDKAAEAARGRIYAGIALVPSDAKPVRSAKGA